MEKAFDTDPVLIETPVPIVTQRLILRPHRAGDGKLLAKGTEETWDDLQQWFHAYMGTKDKETDPRYKEIWALTCAADFAARKHLRFIIEDAQSHEFIGVAGLINPDWRIHRLELDYWITKSAQGKGYATEASRALIKYAFDVLKARLLTVGHAEGNMGSQKIIENLGFKKSATEPYDYETTEQTLISNHRYHLKDANHLSNVQVKWGLK